MTHIEAIQRAVVPMGLASALVTIEDHVQSRSDQPWSSNTLVHNGLSGQVF